MVGIIVVKGHHGDLPSWFGKSLLQDRKGDVKELLECLAGVVALLALNAGHWLV